MQKREIRVLCVQQPWAWLIVNGHKDIENRNSPPPEGRVGERVYICASRRRLTKVDFEDFLEDCKNQRISGHPKSADAFEYGALIGSVVITGATRGSKSYWAEAGCSHWKLADAKKMSPRRMKGSQTLFFKAEI